MSLKDRKLQPDPQDQHMLTARQHRMVLDKVSYWRTTELHGGVTISIDLPQLISYEALVTWIGMNQLGSLWGVSTVSSKYLIFQGR